MGNQIESITADDLNPAFDLLDVQGDIKKIAGDHNKPVNWGWFQEGYDHEPTDPAGTATNANYIAHHNAPQYFGYEANNPNETAAHMKGLGDFFTAINANALPGTERRSLLRPRRIWQPRWPHSSLTQPGSRGRFPGQRRPPRLLRRADQRSPSGRLDQRDRQQPVLAGERHHHHLR